jgi:hypothetical protein
MARRFREQDAFIEHAGPYSPNAPDTAGPPEAKATSDELIR